MEKTKIKNLKIAIMGKMCSGKTTLSNHIKKYIFDKYSVELDSLTFAGKVYDIAYELFDMSKQTKDRKLLQSIGSAMRSIDENVWINYLLKNVKNKNVIVDDCRYENEFEALEKERFIFIKINISEEYQIERLKRTYQNTFHEHINNLHHVSEEGIHLIPDEKFNIIINAEDNEANFCKIDEFLDDYIVNNIIQ